MQPIRKVILKVRGNDLRELDALVERFMAEGVNFIGVVGHRAAYVEDLIDEILVGDGTREPYFMLTASHEGETVEDAIALADVLSGEFEGPSRVVEI